MKIFAVMRRPFPLPSRGIQTMKADCAGWIVSALSELEEFVERTVRASENGPPVYSAKGARLL